MTKTCASLSVVLFLISAALPDVARAGPSGDDTVADREAIDALLREAAEEGELEVEQHAEPSWLLKRALRRDFARTPTAARMVRDALASPGAPAVPAWVEAVAERRLAEAFLPAAPRTSATALAFDIPLSDHPLVDTYVKYFTGRGRWFFEKWLARADRYLPVMQPILAEKGLPQDLVYVAMVESGFSARAYSVASAAGYWQFIASTAAIFKMEMNVWIDERRDYIRATEAAAAYLTQLHREFGDWHLAWAGYNAGSGRIRRAIDRWGTRDYWALVDNPKSLPKETRHYVAKILAAAIVAKNREAYGFTAVESLPPIDFDEVRVDDAIDLKVVARLLALPIDELRDLNPALLHDVTPPGRGWTMRVPRGEGAKLAAHLGSLRPEQRLSYRQHKVSKGETLWVIAQRFDSSIEAIREFNGITNPRALRLGQTLVIPALKQGKQPRGTASVVTRPRRKAAPPTPPVVTAMAGTTSREHHVVGVGETLWSISQRYGVTVRELKQRNNLADNTIVVGATLKVF